MLRPFIICLALGLFGATAAPAPAYAETCKAFANQVVKEAVEGILSEVVADNAELQSLDQASLVKVAGERLMSAERPDFKAYGYMMLLWYGDETSRHKVAEAAAALQTPEERAHFYFVLGLNQIRSSTREVALEGRDYIRQIRDSGHVTFVNEAMWSGLVTDCEIAG